MTARAKHLPGAGRGTTRRRRSGGEVMRGEKYPATTRFAVVTLPVTGRC